MTKTVDATTPAQPVARSGALSLMGAMTSALMGFVLIIVIARVLGTEGAGVVLQAIAAFTIAMAIAQAGLDTTAVWLLPRLAHSSPDQIRPAVVGLLIPATVVGVLMGAALWLGGTALRDKSDLAQSLQAMAWFLPAGTLMMIALSGTRGLGGVRPFVLINSIAIPTLRPLLILAASWLSVSSVAVTLAWVAPLPIAAALSVVLLVRSVRRWEVKTGSSGLHRPDRALRRRMRTYSIPRWISATLEQAMMWLDVLLVGLLASPAAAGIYGATTRFVGAGLVLNTAMRIVVAPIYSRCLGLGQTAEAQRVYTRTTKWIVLCSSPIYLVFAAFGGTVLDVLGEGFAEGATVLLILSIGFMVVLLAGNIQSMLLMSGHSGLAAINKVIALSVNVLGIFVLVPPFGIEGAAVAWAFSAVLDAGLAAYQVHRLVGINVGGIGIVLALAVPIGTFGVVAVVTRLVMGDDLPGLSTTLAVGTILWCAVCLALRHRLELTGVMSVFRRGGPQT